MPNRSYLRHTDGTWRTYEEVPGEFLISFPARSFWRVADLARLCGATLSDVDIEQGYVLIKRLVGGQEEDFRKLDGCAISPALLDSVGAPVLVSSTSVLLGLRGEHASTVDAIKTQLGVTA